MDETKVVVVGGGMAGLSASACLVRAGFDVILVEAADYLGGRVKQVKAFDGWPPVDVGGEFIHGCETITYRLAVENNWETKVVYEESGRENGELIYLDGKMYPYNSTHPDIIAANTAFDDFIYFNNKNENRKDMSASEYFANHPELSSKVKHVFNTIFCQTEAANLDNYGATEQGNFEDLWPCGRGNYRMVNSCEQLVKYYVNACETVEKKLNWQAKKIDYTNKNSGALPVKVTNQNDEVLKCKCVVVCVPLTVLKDNDIHFDPELPEDKQLAIRQVQMNTGLKITCRFSRRFWPQNCAFVYNCTTDIGQIWLYTNVDKETGEECHIATGFQTADYAKEKASLTADQVKEVFLNDLNQMFATVDTTSPASDSFVDSVYYHWSSHPFVRGAYSSPSVHARGSRVILARPVQDRVFFCGEATRSKGDCCSVSGAIESGIRAADEVKDVFNVAPTVK